MKKNIIFIITIISIIVLLSGCQPAQNTTPPIPSYASLTFYSSSVNVWGYVWVNGFSTGKWIDFNGAVTVTGLSTGLASVQVVDNWGAGSHMEYINLVPGNNVVNFTYW